VARIFDATNMRLFTRPLDQYTFTTYYAPDGTITHGPALSIYQLPPYGLPNPRSTNWNLSVEQRLPRAIGLKVAFLDRHTSRGFSYVNSLAQPAMLPGLIPAIDPSAPNPLVDAIYVLGSQREDQYRSVEFALHQPLRGQHEWVLSYIRSSAQSKAVVERSIDQPLQITSNAGPLPWDTPNRVVSWGYLPTPYKVWSIAYLAEWRTGFPFSVQDQAGRLIGSIDDHRFPQFFELDLFVERQLRFRQYLFALRGGFNNITNHSNPNVVNNVEGGPGYLHVYGGQSRALNFRLRLLGKQ
jgi:hypothetical protein